MFTNWHRYFDDQLQSNVVVYMTNKTKVDVEQHIYGGVAVVGDWAKVNYHHPPEG